MVRKAACECGERVGTSISTAKDFAEIKAFFDGQAAKGIFIQITPETPYYVWRGDGAVKAWYATAWYKCRQCGCLWEFNFPDFPADGFVRKFDDGVYRKREF